MQEDKKNNVFETRKDVKYIFSHIEHRRMLIISAIAIISYRTFCFCVVVSSGYMHHPNLCYLTSTPYWKSVVCTLYIDSGYCGRAPVCSNAAIHVALV